MRVSWGGAIGPLTRIGVGGTDTPKRYWGLIQRPGISQAYQEIGHVKHSPRAAMFDANGALAPGLHPPTHPCQIVSHAAAAGSVCISFMSEASLYLRQRAWGSPTPPCLAGTMTLSFSLILIDCPLYLQDPAISVVECQNPLFLDKMV